MLKTIIKVITVIITIISYNSFTLNAQEIIWENLIEVEEHLGRNAVDIHLDDQNNIYILYRHIEKDIAHSFLSLHKLKYSGEEIWSRTINPEKSIFPQSIEVNENGDVVCVSILARGSGIGWYAIFRPHIVKFDKNGTLFFEYVDTVSTIKSSSFDFGKIYKDSKEQYNHIQYIKGELYNKKYDSQGQFISETFIDTTYRPKGTPDIRNIFAIDDSTYIILGSARNMSNKKPNIFVTKYSGYKKEWHHFYDLDSITSCVKILSNIDSYSIFGRVVSTPILRTISNDGAFVAQAYLPEVPSTDAIIDGNGNYLLAGTKSEVNSFHLVSVDNDYNIVWEYVWGDEQRDNRLSKVIQLPDNNVLVAGSQDSLIYIAKIKNPLTSVETEEEYTNTIRCYPNPVTKEATIEYFLEKASTIKFYISNSLGEKQLLLSKDEYSGPHVFTFDVKKYASGTYYISLFSDNNIITKKIIIIN